MEHQKMGPREREILEREEEEEEEKEEEEEEEEEEERGGEAETAEHADAPPTEEAEEQRLGERWFDHFFLRNRFLSLFYLLSSLTLMVRKPEWSSWVAIFSFRLC